MANFLPPLLDELAGLNALLHSALKTFRRHLEDPYRGLYVSDRDADEILEDAPQLEPSEEHAGIVRALRRRWQELDAAGAQDPLNGLVRAAQLGFVERGVLLLCLAPEIDLRYQRLYAYLHDDIAKKAPTVELALQMFCADSEERLLVMPLLAPEAPLQAWGLLDVLAPDATAPFLASSLKLTERARHALLGGVGAGPAPPPFVERVAGQGLPDALEALPVELRRFLAEAGVGPWLQLVGEDRSARRRLARRIAEQRSAPLLIVDCRHLVARGGSPDGLAPALRRLHCESLVADAVIYWDDFDVAPAEPGDAAYATLRSHLLGAPGQQLFGTRSPRPVLPGDARSAFIVELPKLTLDARERLWRDASSSLPLAEGETIAYASLAARYPLDAEQIQRAARLALSTTDGKNRPLRTADLERACRITAAPDVGDLAEHVSTRSDWQDLVLPEDKLEALREVCLHARYRGLVGERWGFNRTTATRGLSALFSGPSGTGKTFSAGIIARELGLDLYRVDLARLVSKYIGETEKNIARIFDATRRSGACLLFDEADAVFAKRSEVKDSHDRFANLETSYLLQRLEQHDGIVFLSTNFRHNIDSAFTRRLSFIVHFTPPDESQRAELWRRVWPPEVPLATDIDFAALARKHTLTGGNIRTAALAAAVRACAEGRDVRSEDIEQAIGREYEKMGKARGG